MREEIVIDNQSKYLNSRANGKPSGHPPKPKSSSSWGSQIVKGFVTDKKSKPQALILNKKPPVASLEVSRQKNQYIAYQSRVKRSLIGDFPCSDNSAQIHPHALDNHWLRSPSSHDLFIELDHLRGLIRDSKDRELALQSQLQQYKENPRVSELEKELDAKRTEIERLNCRVGSLQVEKDNLLEQLASLTSILEAREDCLRSEGTQNTRSDASGERRTASYRNLEMEVVELRRLNKELQLQKRSLAFRLSSTESQLAALAKVTESELLVKVQKEASVLRHTNENLCKQVEGLQMSRLTEVEELAYLRWVNSCLRHELSNSDKLSCQTSDLDEDLRIKFTNTDGSSESYHEHCCTKISISESCNAEKVGPVKKLSKRPQTSEDCKVLECQSRLNSEWIDEQEGQSPRRRHSISGPKDCIENLVLNKRRQSDGFIYPKEMDNDMNQDTHKFIDQKYDLEVARSPRLSKPESYKVAAVDVEKRALRIPNPPPRPSTSVSNPTKTNGSVPRPPPPPPPPPKFSTRSSGVMQRAPQVAELYHSLMKRDSRRDSTGGGISDVAPNVAPNVANVRSSMIGEIENRSSHLLAIKADVETQGEFVKSLIKEVNDAAFHDIEDVVAFVKWLDDELCFLVDERAVLKHFDWPEKKADTLREAAFGCRDLKILEAEITKFKDNPSLPCDVALKKIVALSEKMERSVYNLLQTRDVMMRHCKDFQVPTDWMLDNGIISKIKFASVKLAKNYMKRVATELQVMGASNKDPALEYMLLQGVRFAFRIHQFAGGFDSETMHVFEELQNLAHVRKNV